jgi:glycerol-3-phosphate acyltransferase PlsY
LLELGLKVFLSYIAGSINGALFVGQLFGGVDIRKSGSGNAGGTNALRTQGKTFAALVMLIDIAKGVVPVLLLPGLGLWGLEPDPDVSREWLLYACGGAAIFGHCYPVWFEFRGGKGAATTLGVVGAIGPILLLPATLVWIASLILFGYVGLATVLSAFALPLYVLLVSGVTQPNLLLFMSCIAVFVAYTHRSNLRKLMAGAGKPDFGRRLLGRSRSDG